MAGIKASSLEQRQVNRCIPNVKGDVGIRLSKDQSLQWMIRPVYITNRFAPRLKPLIKTIAFNSSDYSITHMTVKLAIESRLKEHKIKISRETVKFIQFLPYAVQLNIEGMDNRWIVQLDTKEEFETLIRYGMQFSRRHIVIRDYAILQEIEIEIWKMLNEQRQQEEAAAAAAEAGKKQKEFIEHQEEKLITCVENEGESSDQGHLTENEGGHQNEEVKEATSTVKKAISKFSKNMDFKRRQKLINAVESDKEQDGKIEEKEQKLKVLERRDSVRKSSNASSVESQVATAKLTRRNSTHKGFGSPVPPSTRRYSIRRPSIAELTVVNKAKKRTTHDFEDFTDMLINMSKNATVNKNVQPDTAPVAPGVSSSGMVNTVEKGPHYSNCHDKEEEEEEEEELGQDEEQTDYESIDGDNISEGEEESGDETCLTPEELSDEDLNESYLLRPTWNLNYNRAFNLSLN